VSLIKVGQRYMSETEPELGLGIISMVESKTVKILFPASKTERTYGTKGAPLKRVIFVAGDDISLKTGEKYIVDSIIENAGLVTYIINDILKFEEEELSDAISFNRPEERLFNGNINV
jgi:ATP-dependent helicase HepA